ncbi:MAG: heme-binding protein [Actinobacteria bacterium]|nr:heme-binding protein [Actinomycetota bacterium]
MTRPIPQYTVADLEYLNDIQFDSFTTDDAVDLGLTAVEVIREWDLSLAVDILMGEYLVFRARLKETGPGNDPWLEGKARTVRRFGEASYLVKLRHLEAGTPFEERDDVDHETFKAHGGSIPIKVAGEVVATLTVSGEPQEIDHEVAAETLRRFLEL